MTVRSGGRRRVTIVGGGAVGLSVALELARSGWRVEVLADAVDGSASAAAAGMLAPASEALLDGMTADATGLLVRARERWDVWAARLGLELRSEGAVHLAKVQVLNGREAYARALGLAAERRPEGLWLPQDALIQPEAALDRLSSAAVDAGAMVRPGHAVVSAGGLQVDGEPLEGEVVVAAGWGSAALVGAAPELAALRPIKGQLLRIAAGPVAGPVLRTPDAYLAPGSHGWTVGATMEAGRSDLAPDPRALARLRTAATRVRPELEGAAEAAAVGVRAATPDGLPLVGRSRTGVWLATGMRRNGWLLAPLVAESLAAMLRGGAGAEHASAWAPGRVAG